MIGESLNSISLAKNLLTEAQARSKTKSYQNKETLRQGWCDDALAIIGCNSVADDSSDDPSYKKYSGAGNNSNTARRELMKPTLYISIAVNLLLGAAIVFGLGHDLSSPQAGENQGAKVSGVDTNAQPVHDEYWLPRPIRDFRRQSAQVAAAEQARRLVVEQNGQSAVDDPAFRALFRPLDPEFPFLSSAKQIELERLRYDVLRRRAELLMQGDAPDEQLQIRRDFDASLRQLLTADELFEYQLRTSPAAQTLLTSGFQFEEAEFRQVFRAVVTATGEEILLTGVAYPSNSAAVAAIRSELGEPRFAEYQRAKDPMYRLLRSIGRAHGLSSDSVEQAYSAARRSEAGVEGARRSAELKANLGEAGYKEFQSKAPAANVASMNVPIRIQSQPAQLTSTQGMSGAP